MIPEFNEAGLLPVGIHSATLDEFVERFAIFDHSDRRLRLFEKIESLVKDARRTPLVTQVLIVGSYVTSKPEPNDFDCLIVLDSEMSAPSLRPFEYNLVSRRMARRLFGGDVFAQAKGSSALAKELQFFQRTRDQQPMGIVEILL